MGRGRFKRLLGWLIRMISTPRSVEVVVNGSSCQRNPVDNNLKCSLELQIEPVHGFWVGRGAM